MDSRIIDLVARATQEFEAAPLEARFTYPPGASRSSPEPPLALLGPYHRGREFGMPPTRCLRYILPSVDVTLREVVTRPQATLIGASRELCWDSTRTNTFILRTSEFLIWHIGLMVGLQVANCCFGQSVWVVPIVPAMQCFHPIDAPNLGDQYCTGECVWTGFEGDYYSEPPRSSTPPESVITVNGDGEEVSRLIYRLTFLMFIILHSQRLLSVPPPSPAGLPPTLPVQPHQHQHITPPMTQLWAEPFIEELSSLPTTSTVASLITAIGSCAVNPLFPNPNPLQFVPPHLEISTSTKLEAALELEYIMGRCWGDENSAMLLTPHRDFRL